MIAVDQVTKCYGEVTAVEQVSFRIQPGEIVGFLGPNGAGKSTLLKMISTWLVPTSGAIEVDGHDTQREPLAVRRSLGYLPEHNALYEGMRVDRFLHFVARAHGLAGSKLRDRLQWVIDHCSLDAVLVKRIQQCSKGYRQRVGLAASLVHDPPVLVLDEPTHGLDPLQVVAFRDFITKLREKRSIIFSSHILSEVLSISRRVLVIHRGKLLFDGAVSELEQRAKSARTTTEEVILDMVRQEGGEGGRS
jgi:gliding motility-associated transport system ATP-binding protein